jgi:hypothetical protein
MIEESPLVKKLLIRPTHRILLVNAPAGYTAELGPLPREVQVHQTPEGQYDLVQLFVIDRQELERDLAWLLDHLREDTIFWITYPKKSSGIRTDLGMMQSWDETARYGLSGVAAASIDDTWTALRFKPDHLVKKSGVGNQQISGSDFGEYIDVANRKVTLPDDVKAEMMNHPVAMSFYEELSYTNKKEYVLWILTAKQEKTRQDRISKMVQKLLEGMKNPAQK